MRKKWAFLVLFFGCFGMATEIFFVAFTNLFTGQPLWDEPLWSLTGKTYVWMFPIYALIPLAGRYLMLPLANRPLWLRLLIYTAAILSVEFVSGWLLDLITGSCPWEYTTGWHVMGYIRLDYAPAWAFFAWLVERLFMYLYEEL